MADLLVESPLYQEIQLDGRKAESQKILHKIIERKLGILDEITNENLAKLSLDEAESLAVAIFDFDTIEDLHQWLDSLNPSVN